MTYSIRPEKHELRKARSAVESALERCKYILQREESLKVNLGASPEERHGAHGLAHDSKNAQIYFNPDVEDWEQDLKKTAISVYGEAWFYENVESTTFVWQEFLASITGLFLLEETVGEREIEGKDLKEEWSEKKEVLEKEISAEKVKEFSWELKLAVGRKLLENHDLNELPDLKLSEVQEAGERL